MSKQSEIKEIAERILSIDTLEAQHRDSLDFWELSVWAIEEALNAAYDAGKASATESPADFAANAMRTLTSKN